MLTFVLFLMGAFVMWRWVLYLWCDRCGKKVRDTRKSKFCPTCRAEFEIGLEEILDGR